MDDNKYKTNVKLIGKDEYLRSLEALARKTMDPNISSSEFSDLDYILLLMSKFVIVKETFIIKKSRKKLEVDFSQLSEECLSILQELASIVGPNYCCERGIDWVNLTGRENATELENLVLGINIFNDIRNAIGHGNFELYYDYSQVESSYIDLFLNNRYHLRLSMKRFESLLSLNYFSRDILSTDSKDNENDKDFPDNRIELSDDINNKKVDKTEYGIVWKWIDYLSKKLNCNVNDVLEKADENDEVVNVLNELSDVLKLAARFGVSDAAYLNQLSIFSFQDTQDETRETRLIHVIRTLSVLIREKVQNEFMTSVIYSYGLMTYSTSMDSVREDNLVLGLIPTSNIDISVYTGRNLGATDKAVDYLNSLINICNVVDSIQLDSNNLEGIVESIVKALAKRNVLVFNGLRNSIDHLNVKVDDGDEVFELRDLSRQTDESTEHFNAKLTPQTLFEVTSGLSGNNYEKFNLANLLYELKRVIETMPNIDDNRKKELIDKIKLLYELFNSLFIDMDQPVVEFCPNLVKNNTLN